MNLEALRVIRLREIAWERYQVRQHPLNQYPEGHPHWLPPLPVPPDLMEMERMRWEASKALQPLWDAGVPIEKAEPHVGDTAIWGFHYCVFFPVRLAKCRGSAWFVERLDDPPRPVEGHSYAHPSWYNAEWRSLRLYHG